MATTHILFHFLGGHPYGLRYKLSEVCLVSHWSTSRGDFVFCADRLIRLVVEEGLNQLPYSECTVTTPTGHKYDGVKFEKGNCGVSIMRSGEAMEQGLRDCCRSIRIGKILIQSDEDTQKAKVYYAKFPPDISRRKVLLMYPILSTGNTVIEAVRVLTEHGLQPKHIILLSLFSTPHGAKSIIQEFPEITILTTEVHPVAPTHFGQRVSLRLECIIFVWEEESSSHMPAWPKCC
uniref:uracil phosphoribosyltransferase homolog isoform X3 n=1 Tax=Oncorhynchus gorbuscha TaxID=8017 RepID=UPI001EAF73F7|nr:uracil phosphoribosyltransferase homolog isoform X3 [Oncorhynchus gorbuscha]